MPMAKPFPKAASSGGGGGPVKVFDQTLAAPALTIDTGVTIPTGGIALDIVASLRTDDTGTPGQTWFQFNGDTGANYQWQRAGGATATPVASNQTPDNGLAVLCSATPDLAGSFSTIRMTIANYDVSAAFKQALYWDGNATDRAFVRMGVWKSNAIITRIVIVCLNAAQHLVAGSRLSVFTMGP